MRILFSFLIIVLITAATYVSMIVEPNVQKASTVVTKENEVQEENPKEEPAQITLSAIGDILIHSRVYDQAKTTDAYDFMPMLEEMKPYLSESTIAIANQETMIGGTNFGLSTYPRFNSPVEVGDALQEIGVDVVSLANNHTLDRGEEVVQSALNHWDKLNMMYVGAYKNKEDQETVRVFDTEEGIQVAFLSYTYGTNGIPIPEGKGYLVNLIDRDKIAFDIKQAKDMADVVVVSLHHGLEYQDFPSEEQKDLARFVVDEGADLILGHHPHVLQPVEKLAGKDGNEAYVIYSLGNFFSGQTNEKTRIGGIFTVSIEKGAAGTKIHSPKFMPTHVRLSDWKVEPLAKVTNDTLTNADAVFDRTEKHMKQWLPELEFVSGEKSE